MNLFLVIFALQMSSLLGMATMTTPGGSTRKTRCQSEMFIRNAADTVTNSHLIFGPPDSTGDHPSCYGERKCALVVCPIAIGSSSEFTSTTIPLTASVGGSNRQVYLNVSMIGRQVICAGSTTVQYAELRFSGDFEYVTRMCRECVEGSKIATIITGTAVPAKDPATRNFYFSVAFMDDDPGFMGGSFFTSNKATNITEPLQLADLVEGILRGSEDPGFSSCKAQLFTIYGISE